MTLTWRCVVFRSITSAHIPDQWYHCFATKSAQLLCDLMDLDIHAFLDSMESNSPTFRSRIEGAPPDDVLRYESLLGSSLPSSYREYVAWMGVNNGGLALFGDAWANLSSVVSYYAAELSFGRVPAPKGYALVAYGGFGPLQCCLALNDPVDGPIVASHGETIDYPYSDSFTKLLWATAFLSRGKAYSFNRGYEACSRKDSLALLQEAAPGLGYHIEPFSDSFRLCGSQPRSLLWARQLPQERCVLVLIGNSKKEINSIAQKLPKELKLVAGRWSKR